MKIDQNLRSMIRESWQISWPMSLVMFFEFLIGLADVYIAGRFGKEVQASYGLAFQIYFVFIIIGIALSVGSVSVISRLFTSGKKDDFELAVNSSISASLGCGAIVGLLGIVFSSRIINGLNIPLELKGNAISLLQIYSLGYLFDYFLINANGVLRSSKRIISSMQTMCIVCVLNIALNFILAFKTPLGFRGIAVATVISLFAGCVLNSYHLKRFIGERFRISFNMTKQIFNIGWPSGILHVLFQLGSMVLFMILGALPENKIEIMAAFTNGLKIESAIFLPAFAFNMANSVVVGNLLGQKKDEEAVRNGVVTALMGVIIVSIMTVLIMINARLISGVLSDNINVVNECTRYIYIALLAEPIMAWGVILGGGLNGAGDTKSVMLIAGISIWLVRIPLCYILGVHFALGAAAVWWSMNASILVQSSLMTVRYFHKKWIVHT